MNLVLDKKYSKKFVYKQIPKIILNAYKTVNRVKLYQVCSKLNISIMTIDLAIRSLKISETANSYIVAINDKYNYDVNTVTYGDRSTQGYPIILNIFNFIKNNINNFYERWLNGDTILW